jgi:hypothetical protein
VILQPVSIEVPAPRYPHRALRAAVFARHFDDAHLLERYFEFRP